MLDLKLQDKAIIEGGAMLTDRHVYAAHKMLGMEFSHLFGLHAPVHTALSKRRISGNTRRMWIFP